MTCKLSVLSKWVVEYCGGLFVFIKRVSNSDVIIIMKVADWCDTPYDIRRNKVWFPGHQIYWVSE